MAKLSRRLTPFAGGLIVVFGLACLNYTKVGSLEHHRAVAEERGWPLPSPAIAYSGMVLTAAGAALVGWSMGRQNG
jgi:hypothetical protein